MKKYKVGVCGNFDTEHTIANGQTIKTINVANILKEKLGSGNVKTMDTYPFKRKPLSCIIEYLTLMKECENVVILPAVSAVKILAPVAARLKNKLNCRVYYLVIGAWLGKLLKNKSSLLSDVKKLDGVFPETVTLKEELEGLGADKVKVLPNFKMISPLCGEQLVYAESPPYKICFFARVIKQKGIEKLISAVKKLNDEKIKYILDIYGPVDEGYAEEFEGIKKEFTPQISYKGVIPSSKSVEVLKDYFLQVFPTEYITEGIPGSIVDSYCAGVPVLASEWNSSHDIIENNKTGIIYKFADFDALCEELENAYRNPQKILDMKAAALNKAREFGGDAAIGILLDFMEAGGT